MAEVLSKRTEYQKVFDDPPGSALRAVVHAKEIHYLDDADEWQDVDGLTDQATITTKDKRVQFSITNGYFGASVPGHHLGFRPWKIGYFDSASGQTEVLQDADFSNASVDGNVGTITDVFPGSIDLQVQFAPRRMRKRFRLPSKPSLPNPNSLGMTPATTYLVFGYEVDNTSNLTFINDDTDQPFPLDTLVHADIRLENAQSEEKLRILKGSARPGGSFPGATYPVYYLRTAAIPFGEAVAYDTIQDADYPLIVDPSPTVYSGTEDGEIWDATFVDTSADVSGCGIYTGDVYRYYSRFDLSGIDAEDTCDLATLEMWVTQLIDGGGTITPKIYTTDWGPTLTSGDHGQAGNTQGSLSISSISTSQYNVWGLTEADVEAKFGGYCSFETRCSSETGDDDVIEVQTADYTGTSHDPKLEITYTEGGDAYVTPGADALSLSGQTPTVVATGSVDAITAVGAGSVTLTGQSPMIVTEYDSDGLVLYNAAKAWMFDGTFDLDTDAVTAALLGSGYTPAVTHDTWSDVSGQEASGYTQLALAGKDVSSVGVYGTWDANNLSFGPTITTAAKYLVLVQGTAESLGGADKLIGYAPIRSDLATITVFNSALNVNWSANGIWRAA